MTSVAALNARSRYALMSPAEKEARKAQMRKYAAAHRPPKKLRQRKIGASTSRKEWPQIRIIETKLALGSCVDCALPCEDWNHVMFAFDHLDPTVKLFSMSKAAKVKGLTMEMLVAELDKCELVCHNCHAFRTYIERAHDHNPRTECVSGPEPLFEQ